MKKNYTSWTFNLKKSYRKTFRIMKLSVLFFLLGILQLNAASILAQNSFVSLTMHNVKIDDVFKAIEKQSSYEFFYNNNQIDVNKLVTIDVKNAKICDVVNKLLESDNLTYKLIGKRLVLVKQNSYENQLLDAVIEAQQQQKKVNGTVTDVEGQTMVGVTVSIKGTTKAVLTDNKGNFSIDVMDRKATLVFSYIGYVSQEYALAGENSINIIMQSSIKSLDEVVVVGYGTQKKVNLTGSISSISTDELESRPITQTSQALTGLISGVTVSQISGRPGNDASSIIIRGMGTFSSAGNTPLVLVDGLASSIDAVDPDNIKSISVLKDAASASIYGTRAANGVILIETKRGGKAKLQVSYNNYIGWQKVTELPQFLDSWEYATLKNEANANEGKAKAYTDEEIAKFKSGSDPNNYPNVPHLKNMLNSGSGFQTNHNVSFTDGDEKNSYLFSLGYLRQDGVVAKNNYNKYNFLLNFDSKIKDNLKLKVDLSGNTSVTEEPRHYVGDMMNMMGFAVREGPIYAGKKSDGTYGYQDDYSPEAWMNSESFNENKNKYFLGGAELSWEIFKGLTLSGKAGYNYSNYTNNSFLAKVVFDQYKTLGPNSLSVTSGDNSLLTLQSLLQYAKKIDQHSFNILAGFSQEAYREDWTLASRDNFPNNSLYELNAGAATNMNATGSGSEWALRSYFGRLNYSFKDKYLFEANARYDGTSRFPEKGRWGLFPSFSAGWRISEESFIKDNLTWINNLKLRASWGKLGNQNVGNYPYQNVLSLGQNYSFGGALASGAKLTTLSNADIHWESTKVTDIGLDVSLFNGKLSMVVDYFDKTTSNILYNISVSQVLGLTPSSVNAGEVKNSGFELLLNYQTSIGKLKLGVIPNFSYIKNEVTKLASVQQDIAKGLFVGQSMGAIYGYVADGLFVDAKDVASYPKQPYTAEPGFIRYKDISGPNGVPDGVVDATYDRKVIGSTFPKYSYGATITADYKGFDFSVLLQGLAGYDKQMAAYEAVAFNNNGQIQRWQADNRWTTDNPDPHAKYIKLTNQTLGSGTTQTSTFWNRSADFMRLKNLQIGYSIPNSIIEKLKISKLRIFFSGQNLFSLNHFYPGWDPESSSTRSLGIVSGIGSDNPFYPISSVYSFGVNVKF
jgi:TonB-linked SusC/RagA family outer membrane protein